MFNTAKEYATSMKNRVSETYVSYTSKDKLD
jgi:hypothetical protein